MKTTRILFALLILASLSAPVRAEMTKEWPPPKEIVAAVGTLLPPFAIGATGDLLAYPWAITSNDRSTISIGFGFRGGFYYGPDDQSLLVSLTALANARLGFTDEFSLDVESGAGALMSRSTVIYATVGVAPVVVVNENWTLRACVAADFARNPGYDPYDPASTRSILWFRLGAGVLWSIGTEPLFSRLGNQDQ